MNLLQRRMIFSMLLISILSPLVHAETEDKALEYLSLNNHITTIWQQHQSVLKEPIVMHKAKQHTQHILLSLNEKINNLEALNVTQDSINLTTNNKTLEVDATAYTSHAEQTNGQPMMTAWGDHLKPTTKAIAVSRDLLTEYGLTYRTKVTIAGFSGEFLILDKMHKRWRKRIDIYMGMNRKTALQWGRRKVELSWKQEAI